MKVYLLLFLAIGAAGLGLSFRYATTMFPEKSTIEMDYLFRDIDLDPGYGCRLSRLWNELGIAVTFSLTNSGHTDEYVDVDLVVRDDVVKSTQFYLGSLSSIERVIKQENLPCSITREDVALRHRSRLSSPSASVDQASNPDQKHQLSKYYNSR